MQLKQLEEELQGERRLTKEAKEQINALHAQLEQATQQQVGGGACRGSLFNIAANPPKCFVIIRKSKLEYEFPNDESCFRIIKIRLFFFFSFFPPCSVDNTVRLLAAINIRACSLILYAAGYNSLPVPVHVHHFLQLQGARPPSRILPH